MSNNQEQAYLYLLCGLPCSGKTTFASRLAKEQGAVVFSLDRLVLGLFPEEDNFDTHRKYVQRVNNVFFPIVHDLLCRGCSVVMDFPAHTKSERNSLRQVAIQAGAKVQLYHLQADLEVITERIQQRNANLRDGEYYIPNWLLNMIITKFESPDSSENPIEIWLEW
ncbi:ATP-binding protein [Leptolyngbya sp. NK1-12]|uniref:ATP-binding protein n=1 Tax=Leptolyngbya sp. NK1-12 TaxID=2547451 RepID=A0AA96WLU8_9CYAN|nr:ATP-binding protein [Leptolyngbya sp. NK1-12]WNZ23711.1 ATP-binding protein [Leptolyngbya sp. NK1-12]